MDMDLEANQSFDQEETEKDDLECDLCKISYSHEQEFRDHAWSLMHHIKIEKKKKGSTHNCTLCFATCPSIIEYGKHLNGEKHKRASEGQRRQKEKETMTFQKEALLNKRVQDDSMLPGHLDNEGNLSDPELSRHYRTSRHGKSHQRSYSQPYIKGKGKGKKKALKGNGNNFDAEAPHFPSNDVPSFHPRGRNTDFHDGNQRDAYWGNDYDVNWESGGFVQQSDWGFNSQSNWEWWDGNMNPHRDDFSFHHRYQTRHSQDKQRGKNKQFKGIKQYRWNRHDDSNERYGHGDQEDSSYWNRGPTSSRHYRTREDHSWDRTAEQYPADRHCEQPKSDFPGHMTEAQRDLSIDSDMAGVKRRCTSDPKDKSKSRKKTVTFDNPSQQRKDSGKTDSDSRLTRDSGQSGDVHRDKRYKAAVSVVQSALEPDSTTEGINLEKKTCKGKKKDKSKKKKGSSVKSVGEVTEFDDQHGGSTVLEKAEQLCRELRDKRQLVKKEREKKERQKKMEKAEEINSQIKNLSKINQSYLKGHIAGCEEEISRETGDSDQSSKPMPSQSSVRARTQKEHDIDDIRKGIESVVNAGKHQLEKKELEKDSEIVMKSSSPKDEKLVNKKSAKPESKINKSDLRRLSSDESVADPHNSPTAKTSLSKQDSINPLNIGTFSPLRQESLSRQSSRASSDMSTDLDPESSSKDTLLKMVNSPRSRKERERLAKMLRSYAYDQNKLSFPRFNLQFSDLTAELDGVATELRLEDLAADVQLQIAELIEADIKPDLSCLDAFVLESQRSTSVDQERSHNINKVLMAQIPSSADNVPTRDIVKRNTPHDPKSSLSVKSATHSYLHEDTDFHKNLNPSAVEKTIKDKGPNFNSSDLCIKSEELSEPEQDTVQSERVPSVNKSRTEVDKSKPVLSANKSQHKHLRDTGESMHFIDDSEPVRLKDKTEIVHVSSQYSVPKSKSLTPLESQSVRDSSEPAWSRGSADSLRFKDSSQNVNSRSQTDSEPSVDGSKSVRSRDRIEPLSSREPVQSRNTPGWSRDKPDQVWDGEMSELSIADLSNTLKQEFPPSHDLTSTKQPVGTSLVSVNSQHPTLPSVDAGRGTAARLEEDEGSGRARNSPLTKGLERSDIATVGTADPERSGYGKLDLDRSIPEKGMSLRMVESAETSSAAIGHVDNYKPALGMVDPTVSTGSRSSSTSGSVFDLVYDLSVEEDSLREEMSSTESEIMRLTSLIQTATEELSTKRTHHQQLSRKEQSLRSRRLHVLREAKSLQNLSTDIPAKSVDRLYVATSDGGPSHVSQRPFSQDLTAESSDLDSSRDSNLTRVSPLSSFSHDPRGTSKSGNASDCLIVLSDSSDSSRIHKGKGGPSSPEVLNSKGISQTVLRTLPPPLEPCRDSEGFIEPNKHTLKTFETSKVRLVDLSRDTVDPSRDSVRSVELSKNTLSSVDISKDTGRSFNSQENLMRSVSPNRGAVRSAEVIKDSVRSLESSRDNIESLEPTKDTFGDIKAQSEISVVGSAELKETGFVTLKSLLRAKIQEGKTSEPVKEHDMMIKTEDNESGLRLTTDDQSSSCAVSSTTAETTQPKVNVQYMGHLPGNLFTGLGQKENMFEKLQSFLKSNKAEPGYRSESSIKSDEIVLDTDSNQESVASNVSLGEKIRQYCKGNRRGSTQQVVDSGSDHTLKGSNSDTAVRQQSKPPVSPSVSDDRNLSPSRKRRKTKKERDQSSKRKQKEEYVINSSSECSGLDDDNIPLTELRQRMIFQQAGSEDVCMVETGSDDGTVRGSDQRRSLLEEVQLDSPNESEENVNTARSQRFKLGPEMLASVRAAVKSTIHRSDKGRVEDSVKKLVGPADSVTHIQVSGQNVFVAYQKSNPCRFNLESGAILGQYDCSPCCVRSLAVVTIDDNLCLYACGPSERLYLFDCETCAILKDMELIYQVQCMHESWGRLYLGTDYGAVIGKDAKTGKTFESFQCCDQSVTCISSGMEGVRKILLVAAYTSPIYVCDAISGLLLRMLEGHSKTVFCMQVAGHMVYSGSGDRKVIEHNLVTSEVSWSYGDSEGLIRGVATDKQGHVFYGGQDRYIRCYNRQNHKLRCLFYVGKSPVASNIVTQNDKILYGNKDGVVEVFTVERNPHPCQCGDCSYLFALKGHLSHHMLSDHLTRNSRLFNCPWRGCTNRLSTLHDSKEAEEHLKGHIE